MTEEKWKLVGGKIYRLAKIFEGMIDAVTLAQDMKEKHHVFLSKTKENRWAVYWRAKEAAVKCEPEYYSV